MQQVQQNSQEWCMSVMVRSSHQRPHRRSAIPGYYRTCIVSSTTCSTILYLQVVYARVLTVVPVLWTVEAVDRQGLFLCALMGISTTVV